MAPVRSGWLRFSSLFVYVALLLGLTFRVGNSFPVARTLHKSLLSQTCICFPFQRRARAASASIVARHCAKQPNDNANALVSSSPAAFVIGAFQNLANEQVSKLHSFFVKLRVDKPITMTIMMSILFVRLLMVPLTYQQVASAQKIAIFKEKAAEIDQTESSQELRRRATAELRAAAEISPWDSWWPLLVQMPLTAALSGAVRRLLEKQRDSQESLFWISNISRQEKPDEGFQPLDAGWWRSKAAGAFDTLSVPVISIAVQLLSKKILAPPPSTKEDSASSTSMGMSALVPLVQLYSSIGAPAAMGLHDIANTAVATCTTLGIREYLRWNPLPLKSFNVQERLLAMQSSAAPESHTRVAS